ncbi:acyltransferase family protein [Aliarcobacter skirrowii]|uniref:acyltransferase family protein n=1 Tax=Aliarcobacter skirrowii TaxID=28200 RepID=UPI000D622061|nr:acyltransferase family protein [Aliarcobacter skirrowii]PWE19059.1 hypothetical protein DGF29_09825 [Aliarcobacter skirrowii]PWE24813.1 hypothetical protein DGE88_08755 [Aliarcobacter skirrowii]RJO55005.1 acyltransferase [Aliarcobacter skirrowii]RJO57050.1 acyltransferase [Aliarcobacter skirrowii]
MILSKIISTLTFRDVNKQSISGLDGLRGFAVLFVLGAHSKFISEGFGSTGVWIFFLLSGYLLSNNLMTEYYKNNKSFFSINQIDSYKSHIKKGNNKINLLIPSEYINNELRVDLVSNIGNYKIKEFKIFEIE